MADNRPVLPRFYAPDLTIGHPFDLPMDEAHHLARVLRLSSGDALVVFDGRGGEWRAEVVDTAGGRARVRATEPIEGTVEGTVPITLAMAVLKAGGMDDAVRDATMMGVATIQPLVTEHTTVKTSVAMRPETRGRWQRVALASAKQSRRSRLPSIEAPRAFDEWITDASGDVRLLFVEPSAGGRPRLLKSLLEPAPERATVIIGPEGGWAEREIAAAIDAGAIPVTLGPLTLRAESMPLAALAALSVLWSR